MKNFNKKNIFLSFSLISKKKIQKFQKLPSSVIDGMSSCVMNTLSVPFYGNFWNGIRMKQYCQYFIGYTEKNEEKISFVFSLNEKKYLRQSYCIRSFCICVELLVACFVSLLSVYDNAKQKNCVLLKSIVNILFVVGCTAPSN